MTHTHPTETVPQVVVVPDVSQFLGGGWTSDAIDAITGLNTSPSNANVLIGAPILSREELFGNGSFREAWAIWSYNRTERLLVHVLHDCGVAEPWFEHLPAQPGGSLIRIAPKEYFDAMTRDTFEGPWDIFLKKVVGIEPALRQALLSYLTTGVSHYGSATSCVHKHHIRQIILRELTNSALRIGSLTASDSHCGCTDRPVAARNMQ